MKTWAYIKRGIVVNVILADDEFIAAQPDAADYLDVTDMPNRPGPGWCRLDDGQFAAPGAGVDW